MLEDNVFPMDKKTLKDLETIFDIKLEPINSKLDALTLDMIDVQKKTDVIADIHDMVKDTRETVEDHEQRIQTLESAA